MMRRPFPNAIALGLAVVAIAVQSPSGARAEATPNCAAATPAPHAEILIKAPRATLALGIATTQDARELGLMCVTQLQPHRGMIFAFPDGDAPRDFWMKNTLVPLDMVFVNHDGRVTSVAANVPASTVQTPDSQIARRDGRGTYVIELAGGDAALAGIVAGTKLDVSRVKPPKT